MYRTLTDPGYQKATNKHGRRLNKRSGTPMHVMAAFALKQLPGKAGNLTQVCLLVSCMCTCNLCKEKALHPCTWPVHQPYHVCMASVCLLTSSYAVEVLLRHSCGDP